jgi:hypothetical protein
VLRRYPTISTKFLSPVLVEKANQILQWASEYIAQPHPELGRKGPICPFVRPAINRGEFFMSFHEGIDGSNLNEIKTIIRADVATFFHANPPDEAGRILRTLLIIFPDMTANQAFVLDEIQQQVKTELVRQGLMIGQFHPHCTEPAARNPRFHVSTAPTPLFAIRFMALHDILFLHEDEFWFREYYGRFAHKYEARTVSREYGFIELFEQAKQRFMPNKVDKTDPTKRCPFHGLFANRRLQTGPLLHTRPLQG